jgi:hypothetical protein
MLNAAFAVSALSVLAIYTARIVKDVIGRPVFIVDHRNTYLNNLSRDN